MNDGHMTMLGGLPVQVLPVNSNRPFPVIQISYIFHLKQPVPAPSILAFVVFWTVHGLFLSILLIVGVVNFRAILKEILNGCCQRAYLSHSRCPPLISNPLKDFFTLIKIVHIKFWNFLNLTQLEYDSG